MDGIIEHWVQLPWMKKIAFLRRLLIEFLILLILAVSFFCTAFVFIWLLSFLVTPEPYYHQIEPNYHVRQLRPDSLFTMFVNEDLKPIACQDENKDMFNPIYLPYEEYCNLQQSPIPLMRGKTDIFVEGVDTEAVRYVSGCTYLANEKMSCQKYPAAAKIHLFKGLSLPSAFYFQLQLHLYDNARIPTSTGTIVLNQQCGFFTRFLKDHYGLFTVLLTYGLTIFMTGCIVVLRISIFLRGILEKQKQK